MSQGLVLMVEACGTEGRLISGEAGGERRSVDLRVMLDVSDAKERTGGETRRLFVYKVVLVREFVMG